MALVGRVKLPMAIDYVNYVNYVAISESSGSSTGCPTQAFTNI